VKRRLYLFYVCIIMAIVFWGSQDDDERSWGSSTGRGYYSGGGHK